MPGYAPPWPFAVAVQDDEGPWPFLLAELDDEDKEALEAQELTLRDAFLIEGRDRYLMPDHGAEELEVRPVNRVPEAWLPSDEMLDA